MGHRAKREDLVELLSLFGCGQRNIFDFVCSSCRRDGQCGAWTYEVATKQCTLGFDGLRYLPATIYTHEAAARISTCEKCGKGLDADDSP